MSTRFYGPLLFLLLPLGLLASDPPKLLKGVLPLLEDAVSVAGQTCDGCLIDVLGDLDPGTTVIFPIAMQTGEAWVYFLTAPGHCDPTSCTPDLPCQVGTVWLWMPEKVILYVDGVEFYTTHYKVPIVPLTLPGSNTDGVRTICCGHEIELMFHEEESGLEWLFPIRCLPCQWNPASRMQ